MTEEKLSKIVDSALERMAEMRNRHFEECFRKPELSVEMVTYDGLVDFLKISLEESARENADMIHMILREALEIPHQE